MDRRRSAMRNAGRLAAPSRPARHRAAIVAALALLLAHVSAAADAPAPELEAADAQFMDFLEYLGSWDGEEEAWTHLLALDDVEARGPGEARVGGAAGADRLLSFSKSVAGE
jgi:hypothetical protein